MDEYPKRKPFYQKGKSCLPQACGPNGKMRKFELMKKTPFFFLLLLTAMLVSRPCQGQPFHSISVNDGLSDSYVQSLTRDKAGYMWFATSAGMNRFDGYTFKLYTLESFGVPHNSFNLVAEDGGGNLWFESSGSGLFLYDRDADRLTDGIAAALAPLGFTETSPSKVFVDQEKNLWIASGTTLEKYDFGKASRSSYACEGACRQIAARYGRAFAVLSTGELRQLEPVQETFATLGQNPSEVRITLDGKGRLWVFGRSAGQPGYYDIRTRQWHPLTGCKALSGDYVTAVIDDSGGNLWFGTGSSGIVFQDAVTGEQKILASEKGKAFSLPNNHINTLYTDKEGIIWIGTGKRGVAYTFPGSIPIETIDLGISEDIGTILEDKEGRIWVGFDGKGLVECLSSGIRPVESFSNSLTGSYAAADGRLYFCSYGDGVFYRENGRFFCLKSDDAQFSEKIARCRDLFEDADGNLWIQTFQNGIIILEKDGNWMSLDKVNSPLRSNSMTSMTYSRKDDLVYAGTSENLYEINVRTKQVAPVYDIHNITTVYLDDAGILWAGTTEGLWCIDRIHKKDPFFLSERDGLAGRQIQGICSDRNGNLWVTSHSGFTNLFLNFDPVSSQLQVHCIPYFKEDGIGDGRFTKNTILCATDGNILMGYGGDLVKVTPERYAPALSLGALCVTEISVSDKEMPVTAIQENGRIDIDYTDRLTIAVSAMDYLNLNKIRYEYHLDNSEVWTPADKNIIRINSLPHGDHTLAIRASGPASVLSDEWTVRIGVKPPFWKSKAAWALYFLLSLLFIGVLIEMILNRSRKALAKERMAMDEARLQFFTNISHDIRTPLTLIITPLSRLIREHQGEPMEEDLQMIHRSALTLMDEVNQLLDFRKLDKGKSAYNPTYGDLARYLREICASFRLITSDDTIRFQESIPQEPLLMDFDRGKIQRVVYNLLSNAFKYNRPDGLVEIVLRRDGDNAVLQVKDTGVGISDKDKARIFERFFQRQPDGSSITGNGIGLHIVSEYVHLQGGTVAVEDNKPQGAVFTVTLPIHDTMRQQAGKETAATPHQTSGKPSVLVVEDNDSFREFLLNYLSAKYDAVGAENGAVALERIKEYPFDIIVSDVMMPQMDGLQLCSAVKNDIRFSHIPIILLSALQEQETIKKGLTQGADEYITKPFDIEILDIKLEKILDWTKENYAKFKESVVKASEITVSKLDEQLIDKAIRIIEEHMTDPDFSVEDLGKEIGMSRSALYKKLSFITGKSPIEFIRILRLKKGKEMLEKGETSISQIAWNVGFSPKQFAKYFKEEYGCLPSDYVKHLKS